MDIVILAGIYLTISGLIRWKWKRASWENRERALNAHRSTKAFKTPEAWHHAQVFSGRWAFWSGLVLFAIAVLLAVFVEKYFQEDDLMYGIFIPIIITSAAFTVPLLATERMLKRRAGETGKPPA